MWLKNYSVAPPPAKIIFPVPQPKLSAALPAPCEIQQLSAQLQQQKKIIVQIRREKDTALQNQQNASATLLHVQQKAAADLLRAQQHHAEQIQSLQAEHAQHAVALQATITGQNQLISEQKELLQRNLTLIHDLQKTQIHRQAVLKQLRKIVRTTCAAFKANVAEIQKVMNEHGAQIQKDLHDMCSDCQTFRELHGPQDIHPPFVDDVPDSEGYVDDEIRYSCPSLASAAAASPLSFCDAPSVSPLWTKEDHCVLPWLSESRSYPPTIVVPTCASCINTIEHDIQNSQKNLASFEKKSLAEQVQVLRTIMQTNTKILVTMQSMKQPVSDVPGKEFYIDCLTTWLENNLKAHLQSFKKQILTLCPLTTAEDTDVYRSPLVRQTGKPRASDDTVLSPATPTHLSRFVHSAFRKLLNQISELNHTRHQLITAFHPQ